MKKILLFFILLGLAILLGSFMTKGAGYVLIAYRTIRIETSLWVALVILILLFILIYIIIRVLHHAKKLPCRLKSWNTQTHQRQRLKVVESGISAYLEEKFALSEKLFSRAIQLEPTRLTDYMFAAKSAQAQKRYKNRDAYLTKALSKVKDAEFPIRLIQVELYLLANQNELALSILPQLYKQHPKSPYLIRQLAMLYATIGNIESLKPLLPLLRKLDTLEDKKLERDIYACLLEQSHDSLDKLHTIYDIMPKYLKRDLSLLKKYINYLFDHNEILVALSLIEKYLKFEWNNDLVKLYSQIAYKDITQQLQTTQKWLKRHSTDAVLLFTIGRLYCHNHQWGEAKHYLEKSIELSSQPFAYQLLGYVEEQLSHKDNALLCYRNSFISNVDNQE